MEDEGLIVNNNQQVYQPSRCMLFTCEHMVPLIRLIMQLSYIAIGITQFILNYGKTCYNAEYMVLVVAFNSLMSMIHIINESFYNSQGNGTRIPKLINRILIIAFLIYIFFSDCKNLKDEYYFVVAYVAVDYALAFLIIAIFIGMIYCGMRICCPNMVIGFVRDMPIRIGASDEEISGLKLYECLVDGDIYKIRNMETNVVVDISEEDAVCSICMETYEHNTKLRYLRCTHHYHQQCLDDWIKINPSCPVCRGSVFDEHGEVV